MITTRDMEEHNTEKTHYEIGFLVSSEDQRSSVLDLLIKHGGEIKGEAEAHGKRISLAYPIKKKTAAYFGWVHFFALPETIEPLSRDLQFNEDVLRFLVITTPKIEKSDNTHKKEQMSSPVKEQQKEEDRRPTEDKPISNEELEKRIEEILQ